MSDIQVWRMKHSLIGKMSFHPLKPQMLCGLVAFNPI